MISSSLFRFSSFTKIFSRGISKQNLIPTVDLSWTEEKIISTISKAAESGGPGFFYLENHGIDQSVFENAIHQSHLFYSTTTSKQKEEISNHGYAGAPLGKSSKGKVIFIITSTFTSVCTSDFLYLKCQDFGSTLAFLDA